MKRYLDPLVKALFALAAAWSVIAGLWIAFTPQTVHSITATQQGADPAATLETTAKVSWYQVQGVWGIAILLIFAALYSLPAIFMWRGKRLPSGVLTVLALVLTFLAGFSIGGFYLPAALIALLGLIVLVLSGFISKVDPDPA